MLKTGYKKGKRGNPLEAGGFLRNYLIRLNKWVLDRRRREKVIWEMITEHSSNPFTDLKC